MNIFSLTRILIVCSFVVSPYYASYLDDTQSNNHSHQSSQAFKLEEEFDKIKFIRDHLKKINKPAIKTIQSPDGDIIDCVLSHEQPAFDHPLLKGQKPLVPPEKPKWHNSTRERVEDFQLWRMSGESCPEGTIPIKRTTEQDMLRAKSVQRFGKKLSMHASNYSQAKGHHEYAIGYLNGGIYNGAKATINIWDPFVENEEELSISQIWLVSKIPSDELNSVEAGWEVNQLAYGDKEPRLFISWTADNYKVTGCVNLLCPGFVQISSEVAIGAAISTKSSYNGPQFDITLSITKDPKANWWLSFGAGTMLGYWPSSLFNQLDHASAVEFGGEIVNLDSSGHHTKTQMGNGHFSGEGYKKASYFRNLGVVDHNNDLIHPLDLQFTSSNRNCYDIQEGISSPNWGSYFYYGGPGRNEKCP